MKWCFVISVALSGACRENEADKLAKVRDEVCACKTALCAEAALERVPKKDVESNVRSQQIARQMLSCLADIYEDERPTTDPDAELPEPSGPGTPEPASARRP